MDETTDPFIHPYKNMMHDLISAIINYRDIIVFYILKMWIHPTNVDTSYIHIMHPVFVFGCISDTRLMFL